MCLSSSLYSEQVAFNRLFHLFAGRLYLIGKENQVCFRTPGASFRTPGGDDRDRTGDLLLAKQALSQLSYVPVEGSEK